MKEGTLFMAETTSAPKKRVSSPLTKLTREDILTHAASAGIDAVKYLLELHKTEVEGKEGGAKKKLSFAQQKKMYCEKYWTEMLPVKGKVKSSYERELEELIAKMETTEKQKA
jgi:hypothetical protein